MIEKRIGIAALVLILLTCGSASAEQRIVVFSGSGNRTTAEFKVDAPWILDWRISSEYINQLSFDLDLVDGKTGVLKGNVLQTKWVGNGVRLFDQSGSFRFRVNGSFVNWRLEVRKLTRAEAAQYTPRTPR